MSSRVPTVDNFILISTDTLRTWSIEEIQAYSTVLSKVIAKETEAINYNQKVIAKNESELVKIDTELKTIDKQVIANQNAIISYNMRYGDSLLFNKNIDSTIASNIKSISDTEDKIIIERKSVNDLLSSIKDGRYEEQSYRLNGLTHHNHNIVYLIEGDLNKMNRFKVDTSAEKLTMYSAMFSLNYYKGFSVFRSFSLDETANIVCNMAYKIGKDLTKKPFFENKSQIEK